MSLDGDHAALFRTLAQTVQDADVVLFPDTCAESLDAFFYLGMFQIIQGQPLTGAFRLKMELSVPPVPEMLTLVVNGRPLAPVMPEYRLHSWDIADGLLQDQPVRIRVERPARACDVKDTPDDRLLGVGVKAFGLFPVRHG